MNSAFRPVPFPDQNYAFSIHSAAQYIERGGAVEIKRWTKLMVRSTSAGAHMQYYICRLWESSAYECSVAGQQETRRLGKKAAERLG